MPDTTAPVTTWQPNRTVKPPPWNLPPLPIAVGRGLLCRCPVCGRAKLFDGYLTVTKICPVCDTPLGLARADDAPPYFTIFAVGHILVPVMLWLEIDYDPSTTLMTAVFVPSPWR